MRPAASQPASRAMKKWLTPLFAVIAALLLGGCASNSQIIAQGLKFELTQIQRSADGTVEVSYRISNPNVVSYLVDRSSHKLLLNGEVAGTIVDTARVGVAATSKVDRKVALTPAAGDRLTAALRQGSASYRLESNVWLLMLDDEVEKASLTASGTVPVSGQ